MAVTKSKKEKQHFVFKTLAMLKAATYLCYLTKNQF